MSGMAKAEPGVGDPAPSVDLRRPTSSPLFAPLVSAHRTLVAANLSAFFIFGAFFAFLFLGSLLMQQVLGYSPTRTGVCWLATSATSFFAAAITGSKLVAVVGVRRLLVVGLSLLAISAALLTRSTPEGTWQPTCYPRWFSLAWSGE